jgi:hypothetical protein
VIFATALGHLAVVGLERFDRLQGVAAVLGVVDLRERGFVAWVRRLRQGGNNIGADVEPAPLLSGVGEHLPQGLPETQRTVTDRQYRWVIPHRGLPPNQRANAGF